MGHQKAKEKGMQESYILRMNQVIAHKRYFIDIIRKLQERKNYANILEEIFEKREVSNMKILDYGCGSGLLASKVAEEFPSAIVHGYDQSLDMIEIARERFFGKNLQFLTKTDSLQVKSYDYIILSSVLHEVYSQFGYLPTIPAFLNELKSFLKPKGYIISRDNYISDSTGATFIKMRFIHSGMTQRALDFINKLISLTPSRLKIHFAGLCIDKNTNTIFGSERAVLEFLNKFTWGEESLPRESQESLFCFSPNDWPNIIPSNFKIISQYSCTDASYLGYLAELVEIKEFFPTHQWTILQYV
jgi:2-polyprenyl-3-methyl-5-hydroxy-6-metoxy-1,4-benzoquinol methylase